MDRDADNLALQRLGSAFNTAFQWVCKRYRAGEVDDFAREWAKLLASSLDEVELINQPRTDPAEPPLPFIRRHKLRTGFFDILRSGMAGGPQIDLLLQIDFKTESVVGGYGIPLIMQPVSHVGPISSPIWEELKEKCARLCTFTPCGRVVLIAEGGDFDWGPYSFARYNPLLAVSACRVAHSNAPFQPLSGGLCDHFCNDLASGWIGDPSLSSSSQGWKTEDFLSFFMVGSILRIEIVIA